MTESESAVVEYFTNRAGAFVNEPGENDVLLLNKQAGHHKGNQRLLEDTEEFRERYKSATSLAEKKELAHQLLARVKDRAGLFLKFNTTATTNDAEGGRRWCIQNYEESSLRVRQILRETTGKMKLPPSHPTGKGTTTNAIPSIGGTSLLTPRIPRSTQHSHHSSEYLEACKVLSDDTMNQACEILLSSSDNNTKDAKEQLLQIYQKCVQAAHVIETEQHNNPNPTATFPLPPILRGRNGSLGVAHAANTATNSTIHKTKTVIPPVNRTRMLHPSEFPHRGSIGHGSNGINHTGGVKGSGLPPSKKVRRAPSPPPVSTAAPSSSVPESALQFLAKLNKELVITDTSDPKEKIKEVEEEEEEEAEDDSQSTVDSDDKEAEQSIDTKRETRAPPVRVQPRRSSRAN